MIEQRGTARTFTAAWVQVDTFDQRSHGASEGVHRVPLQIEPAG